MLITSRNNEIIKNIVKLQDKKYRVLNQKFIVEGVKIIKEVYLAGYEIESIFQLPSSNFKLENTSIKSYEINEFVLNAITTTKSPQDCVAVVKMKTENFNLQVKGKTIVLDNVQDPNNVGAIIRSALGANFDNVILLNCADIYDTKTIRASMGSVFHMNILNLSQDEFIRMITEDVDVLCCSMEGENLFKTNIKDNCFVVIGNEGKGVSMPIRKICNKTVSIPMNSKLESLNAGVSAALVMYGISFKLKEGEIL